MQGPVNLQEMTIRWANAQPQLWDSTLLWDRIIAYRIFVCALLNVDNNEELINTLEQTRFQLLDVTLHQRNMRLSNQLLQGLVNDKKNYKWIIARSKLQSLKATHSTSVQQSLKLHFSAWDRIDQDILNCMTPQPDSNVQIKALQELCQITNRITEIISITYTAGLHNHVLSEIKTRINANKFDKSKFLIFLIEK